MSIAAAVNWLARSNLTEAEVVQRFISAGETEVNFTTVLNGILPSFPGIEAIEYHDHDNSPSDVDSLLGRTQNGAVLILSLELADLTAFSPRRRGEWHMISVFASGGTDAQVWDTNGFAGFFTWAEVRALLVGDSLTIPYLENTFLMPHGQHHCLLLARR